MCFYRAWRRPIRRFPVIGVTDVITLVDSVSDGHGINSNRIHRFIHLWRTPWRTLSSRSCKRKVQMPKWTRIWSWLETWKSSCHVISLNTVSDFRCRPPRWISCQINISRTCSQPHCKGQKSLRYRSIMSKFANIIRGRLPGLFFMVKTSYW